MMKPLFHNVIFMTLAGAAAGAAGGAIGELMFNHGLINFAAPLGGIIGGAIGGYLATVRQSKTPA
jgi:hypothetical protein